MPRPRYARATVPLAHEWSEADLQREVLGACRLFDLLAYHTHDSRRSQPGYPDLTIVGRGGVLFVELKNATNQLEPDQLVWRDRLQLAGAQWRLWRPADWFSGAIVGELSRLHRAPGRAPTPDPWVGTDSASWPPPHGLPPPGMPERPAPASWAEFDPASGHRHDCVPRDRDVCGCAAQLYMLAEDGRRAADWLRNLAGQSPAR